MFYFNKREEHDVTYFLTAKMSAADIKLFLQHSALSLSSNDKLNVFCCASPLMDIKKCNEGSCNDINIQKIEKQAIKMDVSDNTIGSTFTENMKIETQFDSNSTHLDCLLLHLIS